jgi:DNA-binding NarL/FixJ family response regulator
LSSPRVLIVDDHRLFRSGVRAELEPLLEIAGEAGGVDEAVSAIDEHRPEVVLLDVHMPDGGGVEVIRRAARPGLRFLALSVSDDSEDVKKGGANWFLKDASSESEDSDEEVRGKVKSAKDKRLDELDASIKQIENGQKNGDWTLISNGRFLPWGGSGPQKKDTAPVNASAWLTRD